MKIMTMRNEGDTMVDTGIQVLDRSHSILECLASAEGGGMKLSDISARVNLNISTVYRITQALIKIGFIERETKTRSFRLGLNLYSLGAQAADQTGLRRICRPALVRLAAATDETVFLLVRSASNLVSVDREEGTYVIRTLTQENGGVIPLGVGSGGLAILAFLPPAEAEAIIAANAARYSEFGDQTIDDITRMLPAIRERGYAVTENWIIDGISALAMPIRPRGRDVSAALALNTTTARLTPRREEEVRRLLRDEIDKIEEALSLR